MRLYIEEVLIILVSLAGLFDNGVWTRLRSYGGAKADGVCAVSIISSTTGRHSQRV